MGRMIFMRGLLACREMTNATKRDGHAVDAGVIVVPRAQGGPDEFYEVRMVWEEGVLPERSERFSASVIIQSFGLVLDVMAQILGRVFPLTAWRFALGRPAV